MAKSDIISLDTLEDFKCKIRPSRIRRSADRRAVNGGVSILLEKLGIPSGQQPNNSKSDEGDYQEYDGRTNLGRRNPIIVELYGSITPYTVYRYWWVDSIARQTLMMLDKPGLRKKGTIPQDPEKQVAHLDNRQVKNTLAMFGIGVESETEEQKAERIRTELNTASNGA